MAAWQSPGGSPSHSVCLSGSPGERQRGACHEPRAVPAAGVGGVTLSYTEAWLYPLCYHSGAVSPGLCPRTPSAAGTQPLHGVTGEVATGAQAERQPGEMAVGRACQRETMQEDWAGAWPAAVCGPGRGVAGCGAGQAGEWPAVVCGPGRGVASCPVVRSVVAGSFVMYLFASYHLV